MSYIVTTDVNCDKCMDWMHGTCSGRERRNEAAKVAREAGWKVSGDTAYCPKCKEVIEKQGVVDVPKVGE